MPKVTKHLADDQIVALAARLGDTEFRDCVHWQSINRSEIAENCSAVAGLAVEAERGTVSPRTLTGPRPLLQGRFLRPLERRFDRLAAVGPERVQGTATVQGISRFLGRSLHVCKPNAAEAHNRSSHNRQPPGLEHFLTLLTAFLLREWAHPDWPL